MNSVFNLLSTTSMQALRSELFRKVAGSFGLKIVHVFLGLVRSLLFARLLGADGLGTYSFALTCLGLIGIVTKLGIPQLLTRDIPIYNAKSDWGSIRGIINWSNKIILLFSIVLIPLVITSFWIIGYDKNPDLILALCIGLVSLPVESLLSLKLATIKGIHRVILGQIPQLIFAPLFLIIMTSCGYLVLKNQLNVFVILGIYVISNIINLIISWCIQHRVIPKPVKITISTYHSRKWFKSSLYLMFLGCMGMINSQTDVLMLGAMRGTKEVGIYVVANRIASLMIFILAATNTVLTPSIASLYSQSKIKDLQKLITQSSRSVLIVSLLVASVITVFNYWLLLLFGQEFIQGRNSLIILIIGQLVNALVGPVNLLLTMTGHERYTAISVGFGAASNIILNYILINLWGLEGAAAATCISMIVWNTISFILVIKKLKIDSTAFGISI